MLVGYAQVSSTGQNLDTQIEILKNAGCEKIFLDKRSGTTSSRPQLDQCLDYIREGDTLIVWKLDRLGRSLQHLLSLAEEFKERGIEFKSLTEGLETVTPAGKMIFQVMGAMAEFERNLINERIQAGIKTAKENGVKFGRKKVLNPDQIAMAQQLVASGMSLKKISENLGINRTTLWRNLKDSELALGEPLAT